MNKNRIFIAGHKGMVGGAIVKKLQKDDDIEIIFSDRKCRFYKSDTGRKILR